MTNADVTLAGQPVSVQSLRDAEKQLQWMRDVEMEKTPGWLIAARLAVTDALADGETDD